MSEYTDPCFFADLLGGEFKDNITHPAERQRQLVSLSIFL